MAYKKTKNRLMKAFKEEDVDIDEGVLSFDEETAKKDGCNCKDKKKNKNKTKAAGKKSSHNKKGKHKK